MGHTTEFEGKFAITPALKPEHADYLRAFNDTRRMKRDASKLVHDPVAEAAGLRFGDEGAYFVGGEGLNGQERGESVLEYNEPPAGQPGLWCQWVPDESGEHLEWDGGEKFYDYAEWLRYLITHFLSPWGYSLSGSVIWRGEEMRDIGTIRVKSNEVEVVKGKFYKRRGDADCSQ